jgi:hypothetical protein
MTMIVETGAGLDNSTSLCSLVVADGYNRRHPDGDSWEFRDESEKEMLLQAATLQIQDGIQWFGRRSRRTQALDWPRTCVEDRDGWTIASNSIPLQVSYAVAELARILGERRDAGQNTTTPTVPLKKVELGPISIEMATPSANSVGTVDKPVGEYLPRSVLLKISHLGSAGTSGGGSGTLIRYVS